MPPESGGAYAMAYESAPVVLEEEEEEEYVYEEPEGYGPPETVYKQPEGYGYAPDEYDQPADEYAPQENYYHDPPVPHYAMPYEGEELPVGYWHPTQALPENYGHAHPHAFPEEYAHAHPDGGWIAHGPPPPGVLQEH